MLTYVTSAIKNHIAYIEFGTPKSNALPGKILEELAQSIVEQAENPQVKAILMRSFGDKAFCAGASFDELLEITNLEKSKAFFGGFAKVLNAMRTCGKIVVVRVQGKVTGGGVGIACAADYCFAVETASLALTEINLGIGPFVIGPYVERKMGISNFTAMSLDANFRSAEWAKANGVYHDVSATIDEMDVALEKFLSKLSSRSSDALDAIKKVSWGNTGYFDGLMPDRIGLSAALVLKPEAKESILQIKNQLKKT